jgi:hypothetical protein
MHFGEVAADLLARVPVRGQGHRQPGQAGAPAIDDGQVFLDGQAEQGGLAPGAGSAFRHEADLGGACRAVTVPSSVADSQPVGQQPRRVTAQGGGVFARGLGIAACRAGSASKPASVCRACSGWPQDRQLLPQVGRCGRWG